MIRIFRQYIPAAFLWLGIVEASVFVLAIYAGKEFRFSVPGITPYEGPMFVTAALFSLVMVSGMTAVGLYQRRSRNGSAALIMRVVASFFLGVLTMSLIFYALPTLFLGRGAFGLSILFAFVGILLTRFLFVRVAGRDLLKRRILVLGAGNNARMIAELRDKDEQYGFKVVNFVHLQGEHDVVNNNAVIHLTIPLVEYAGENDIDEIVVAVDDRRKGLPLHELLDCKMSGIEIVDMVTFFEKETHRLKLDIMQPSGMIFSDGFRGGMFKDITKRLFDILASLFLLSLAWPFMVITALAILIEDRGRGSIFYRQTRVGQFSKPFEVLKFRSMRVDAEQNGVARWAQDKDERVTRVGRVIRTLRLDELPQIFNVFKGDMSFVGPRPERPSFVKQLQAKIPYYGERHWVKPGITGWAQLCYPYGASEEDAFEKLQYDLYYAKNHNLFLDAMILLQTAEVILWGKGAH